jgi:hypothetical protein
MNSLIEVIKHQDLCHDEQGKLFPIDDLMRMYEESKQIAKKCKEYQEQLKQVVEDIGGMLRSERLPGLALVIKEKEGRPTINAPLAIPVLLDGYFTNDELKDFVTVPMGAMKDALKAKTQPGEKGPRVAQLMESLEMAGAIERGAPSRVLAEEAL